MTFKDRKKDCERFEALLHKESDLTEEELDFLWKHEDSCEAGVHTLEALEKEACLPIGSLRQWRWPQPLPKPDPRILRERTKRMLEALREAQAHKR